MKISTKIILAAVWLSACYGIGQYRTQTTVDTQTEAVVAESEAAAEETTANEGDTTNTDNTSDAVVPSIWDTAIFEGAVETTDNPFGLTAGIIEMDDIGACAMLTPNTSVMIADLGDQETVTLSAEVHPWVSDASDGVGLKIWILDSEENLLNESRIFVPADNNWLDCTVDLTEYPDAAAIKLLCDNGDHNDDAGDWLVLRH